MAVNDTAYDLRQGVAYVLTEKKLSNATFQGIESMYI